MIIDGKMGMLNNLLSNKNMENRNFSTVEHLRDPDKKMSDEFNQFIDDNGYTSEQMQVALLRFYDDDLENQKQDPAVEKILEKIKEMIDNNFPLNRLPELIEAKNKVEKIIPNYFEYIDTLDISPKEKAVLNSIIEKERLGQIILFIDEEITAEFEVPKGMTKEQLALTLIFNIKRLTNLVPEGKRYGFGFSGE